MSDRQTIADHLVSRHLDVSRYKIYVDEHNRVATFIMWNLSGQMVGYQAYKPDQDKDQRNDPETSRYYIYVGGEKGNRRLAVWGLETWRYRQDIVCFTEGVFDACRLHNRGFPACAVLSNNPKHLVPWFNLLTDRNTIGCVDNDAAGMMLGKFFDRKIVMISKDLGDSTEEEIDEVIDEILRVT